MQGVDARRTVRRECAQYRRSKQFLQRQQAARPDGGVVFRLLKSQAPCRGDKFVV